MAQEMLEVEYHDEFGGNSVSADATDNYAYSGVRNPDSLGSENHIWHLGTDDEKATSKFASFDLVDVDEGDIWAFGRHEVGADVDDDGPRLTDAIETMFIRIEDGEATEIDREEI